MKRIPPTAVIACCLWVALSCTYGAAQAPATTLGPENDEIEEPYRIGIWYFTAWSRANNDVQPVAAAQFYGRWDAWGGIRDFVLDTKGFPEYQHLTDLNKFPVDYWLQREPLLGFYDDVDQSIMDAHILEAASRGITYFAFYWYWYPTTPEVPYQDPRVEPGLNLPLKLFLNSKYKHLMKFVLAPIMLGADPDGGNFVSPEILDKFVFPQLVTYMSDPSYLKDGDGRQILINFDLGFSDPTSTKQNHLYICHDTCSKAACSVEAHQYSQDPRVVPYVTNICKYARALNTVREQAIARGLENPDILDIDTAGWRDILYSIDPATNGIGIKQDGAACFQLAPDKNESYAETAARYVTALQKQLPPPNKPSYTYVPCATTGLDARDWIYADGPLPHNTDLSPSVFEPPGSSRFEFHLNQIKQFMDANPSVTHGMMTLYAFNEWGEGGICEPSAVAGYACLDDVARVFHLIPKSAPPKVSASRSNFVSQAITVKPFKLQGSAAECNLYRSFEVPSLDCPLELKPGMPAEVSVTFQNTGTDTWNTQSNVSLAQVPNNPQISGDEVPPLPVASIAGDETHVAPGGRITYTVTFAGPPTPGRYRLEVRLLQQGRAFGDSAPIISLIVAP